MVTQSAPPAVPAASLGRGYFWLGIAVCLLGLAAAVVQYTLKVLIVPWYVPALTTIGVVLLAASLTQRRTITRILMLVVLTVLAGAEWFFIVALARLPEYSGPRVDEPMPAFQTTRADGRSFSNKDLQDGTPHILV